MCARSILTAAMCLMATSAAAQSPNAQPHFVRVGGTVMTNFIGQATTLGTATGDLEGAVSADLVGFGPEGDTIKFSVQHHWVTDGGDRLDSEVATATTKEVSPGLFAVLSYPVTIQGGTGRFAGASGNLDNIGEVYYNPLDLDASRTIFRYSGTVCFAAPHR
jgi:hypothetical protein